VHIHLIPGGFLNAIAQQLEPQVCCIGLLADFGAAIHSLLVELVLLVQVDDEFVALELLDISDAFILREKVVKLFLKHDKLLHNLFLEKFFTLSVLCLKLSLHNNSEKLHVLDSFGMEFWHMGELIIRGGHNSFLRVGGVIN